jgi:type III pantothenate kinase
MIVVIKLNIDVGNSNLKWRLQLLNGQLRSGICAAADLYKIDPFIGIADEQVSCINVCSVASSEANDRLKQLLVKHWSLEADFFKTESQCAGVTNSYANPAKMGADRWLASIAAVNLYPNKAICIVDCGTALNVEFLSIKGAHVGGYILPGLNMMQQSLLSKTAKIEQVVNKASLEPGCDTASNVSNGSYYINLALLEKLQRKMQLEKGVLIITGGGADFFKDQMIQNNVEFKQNLVLDGFDFI